MEVVYTKKKKKKPFYFFNPSHDKFLTPSLLTLLKKQNPRTATVDKE